MSTIIKLNYKAVTSEIKSVTSAKDSISFPEFSADEIGKNVLDITTKWKEQEVAISNLVTQYIQVLTKNLEDTQKNVDLLKEQDESMVRN